MEDLEYSLENEAQFWAELDDIVSAQCDSHELIDNTLRSYLLFTTNFKDQYLHSEYDVARCSEKLTRSPTFRAHADYVRRQIVYGLLQEDEATALRIIAGFLLFDGRQHDAIYEMMNAEGAFGRLVDLIRGGAGEDKLLHRELLDLLYEMCRVHRLCPEDLALVDDGFIKYLLDIIEQLSGDVDDPYHYPVIRVLLVLNEQYMVASATTSPYTSAPLTNRVIKAIGLDGPSYMTFGANIILLLNRETETSLQLLILKLCYLLFTTAATQEYFYTNDLRVLLDVILRNLLDLPDGLVSLRHTYLRVLYPLLANTQLHEAPHYKTTEILKVLHLLGGPSATTAAHFAPADDTTLRLVERVATVPWLRAAAADDDDVTPGAVARRLLGMSLSPRHAESNVSVVDVAAVMEKPGVQTPSRKADSAETANGADPATRRAEDPSLDGDRRRHDGGGAEHGAAVQAPRIIKVPPTPPPGRLSRARHGGSGGAALDGLVGGPPAKKLPPKTPPRRRTRKVVLDHE